ncbi:MAG: hypothetical protein ACTHMM_12195 [Agriterribacter sp.]
MRRYIISLALFALAIFICSCKKNDSPPEYHISCYINDTLRTFNFLPSFSFHSFNGTDINTIGILGFGAASQDMNSPSLEIRIEDFHTKKIVPGIYADTSGAIKMYAQYYAPHSDPTHVYSGTQMQEDAEAVNFKITNGLTVVFTTVSKTVIQGTFSGDFFYRAFGYGFAKPVHITNGSFYLKVRE